jgi:hypothetical protein
VVPLLVVWEDGIISFGGVLEGSSERGFVLGLGVHPRMCTSLSVSSIMHDYNKRSLWLYGIQCDTTIGVSAFFVLIVASMVQ